MSKEYKIRCKIPGGYDGRELLNSLPSPIMRNAMVEIYNYAIEPDGFRFFDRAVDRTVSSVALRLFLDEALKFDGRIELFEEHHG